MSVIIAMSTGVNHGFKQSFPFIIGATIGFTTLLSVIGLGLGEFAAENKTFLNVMGVLGSGFICYMGYKIATSTNDIHTTDDDRPSLVDGAVLQFVNAKAWIACIAGVSAFNLVGSYRELFTFVFLFNFIGTSCLLIWAFAGSKISAYLGNAQNLKIFNFIMGGGLIMVAIYLVFMQLGMV